MYYLFIYMNTRQKYHKLIDKTNKLWIKTNLYTDKLLFRIFIEMEKSNIYIGEVIRSVMADNQITKAELARRLGVRPQSVDYMLTRKSIDTDTLYNVSRALNYDFAMLYSLHEGQTNCDIKESSYNVATAKVLVELELKPEDLAKLNLKKRISDVLK